MLRSITIAIALTVSASAWAQKCSDTATNDEGRFAINPDGTVLDAATGLMWQRCLTGMTDLECSTGSASQLTKNQTRQTLRVANADKLSGYSDWRLPSLTELSSLLKEGCKSPSINLEIFPRSPSSFVWITSPSEQHKHFSWYVHFNTGKTGHIWGERTYTLRLVRTAIEQEVTPTAIDKSQPYWWKKLSPNE